MWENVNLVEKIAVQNVVLSPIFVADTKIIFHHDFVAPLSKIDYALRHFS